MHYSLKVFKFVAMLVIVATAMSGGTASAQVPNDDPIPGLFVGADTTNTEAQDPNPLFRGWQSKDAFFGNSFNYF